MKRTLKFIGIILLFVLIAFAVGYFVVSYLQFSDCGIARAEFNKRIFVSIDENAELDFTDPSLISFRFGDQIFKFTAEHYEGGCFVFTHGDKNLSFWVVDNNTIYNDLYRVYLYSEV